MNKPPPLNFVLFGAPEITLDGEPVTGFISAKAKALLCFLALTRRAQSRHALVALFWGDIPEADAKTQLRVALSNLRKLVGDHLSIERETVAFDAAQRYALDVEELERQIADSKLQLAQQNSPSALRHLQAAARVYRGDLLAGMRVRDAPEFDEWLLVQRERFRSLALDGLWTLFELERARGSADGARDALQRAIELEPWREEAHRELMLLLARAGKRSAALQQYETCRVVLARELGVEPASETTHLYERIRAAGNAPRENLPPPLSLFVGRETELRTIARLLKSETRLLTLLGPGGIGKTRLALQAAAQQVNHFLNGVFFVPLAEVTHADEVRVAIAQALGLKFSGNETPRAQLLNYLQDKELLLMLDNFEQVENGADPVREILARAPAVRLLVTSRERLNLRAEWLLMVEGLPIASAPLETGAAPAALQLFAERARQVAPDFELAREALPVQRICELVGGMPLAIELAATWRRAYSAAEIAQQVERDFDFLATTQRDVRPTHANMRAVFTHSWKMLSASEQDAFRMLAVFHGGFTSDAARQVAGIPGHVLQALADKSLTRALPRVDAQGGLRFGMHEILCQYAREQFEQSAAEGETLRAKHAEYFARQLHSRCADLQGANVKQTVAELAQEHENIAAAWEWACAQTPPHSALLSQMLDALIFFLELRSEYGAGKRMFARAVARVNAIPVRAAATEILLARLLAGESWFCFRLAEFEEGRGLSEWALAQLREHDAWQFTAYPLLFCGASEFGAGQLSAARDLTAQSLAVFRRLNDAFGIAGALNNLGQICMALGDLDAAAEYLRESLETARRAGIKTLQCNALENLGALKLRRGELAAAQRDLEECLVLARENDAAYEIATTQNTLARVALELGDAARAAELLQEAELVWRRVGDRWSLANTLNQAAEVERARGKLAQAERLYLSALETGYAVNATTLTLNSLAGLAELCAAQGDAQTALVWFAVIAQHDAAEGFTRARAAERFDELAAARAAADIELARAQAAPDSLAQIIAQLLDERA